MTFVKLGQVLSTRRDLLPAELVEELSRLQDRAEPVPWPRLETVLARELGRPVAEVFASVDAQPLAAASVGQVHAARLRSGEQVVIKIQRPGIRPVVERDLDIAQRLAARLEAGTGWARTLGLRTLADGLATALREELDYRVEAENIQVVARAATTCPDRTVRVLSVHPALCTERVLVMERLDGTALNAVDNAPNRADVDRPALARSLLDFLLRQILTDGVFHADPHAGNVLLLADGRLGLLDLGSVGRLDGGLREAFGRLLAAIDKGDPLATTDALLEIVLRPDTVDEQRLERDLGRFLARHLAAASTSATARMFGDLFRIVAEHALAVPRAGRCDGVGQPLPAARLPAAGDRQHPGVARAGDDLPRRPALTRRGSVPARDTRLCCSYAYQCPTPGMCSPTSRRSPPLAARLTPAPARPRSRRTRRPRRRGRPRPAPAGGRCPP